MLIVLTGENRLGLLTELERDMKQRSLTEADRFSEDTFSSEVVLATLEQQDLFGGGEKAIVLDQLGSFAEGKRFLEEEAERLSSSAKAVYALESSVPAALGKVLTKAGGEVRTVGIATKGRNSPPIFALSDALAARDKKALWILYQDLSKSAEPEEIAGIFVWQLKTMWLVALGETAGLNPYVVTKARTALRNFKNEEIPKLLFKMIGDYHRGHRGEGSLSLSLEQTILAL
ncbi:hypothetical protein K8Q93_01105 [Candidatus Parcubacteria bacterium]|nr:hypothetical protein [Candidatus Parcubacteria bacterium]